MDEPSLGLATTRQLLQEIKVRRAGYYALISSSDLRAAIRSVIEDSHASSFLRHETSPRGIDETVNQFYYQLVAPVLRKLADG